MMRKVRIISASVLAAVVLGGCFGQQSVDTQGENLKRDGNLRNDIEKEMTPVEPDGGVGGGDSAPAKHILEGKTE